MTPGRTRDSSVMSRPMGNPNCTSTTIPRRLQQHLAGLLGSRSARPHSPEGWRPLFASLLASHGRSGGNLFRLQFGLGYRGPGIAKSLGWGPNSSRLACVARLFGVDPMDRQAFLNVNDKVVTL